MACSADGSSADEDSCVPGLAQPGGDEEPAARRGEGCTPPAYSLPELEQAAAAILKGRQPALLHGRRQVQVQSLLGPAKFIGFGPEPRDGMEAGHAGWQWMATAREAELAWVFERFALPSDPLLAARAARAAAGAACLAGLEQAVEAVCEVQAAALASAVRAFYDGEEEQLHSALECTFKSLPLLGCCVVATHSYWEFLAVRRYAATRMLPSAQVAARLPEERLVELYPLLASCESACVRRKGSPVWCSAETCSRSNLRPPVLHALEKVAHPGPRPAERCPAGDSEGAAAAEQDRGRSVRRRRMPPLPAFGSSAACAKPKDPDPESAVGQSPDPLEDLGPAEKERFEGIRQRLLARKAELSAQGLSVRQQRRDPQVAELARQSQEVFRPTSRSMAQSLAKCRDRTHVPVLLEESVSHLVSTSKDGLYVDCTFGRGGHSRRMLAALSDRGRVKAFDVDASAVEAARALEAADSRFQILHAPFGDLAATIEEPLAGVLLDLGVSSPQLDDTRRGFSFKSKKDGPLDLRMNQQVGMPASEWLGTVSASELAAVISVVGYRLEDPLPDVIAEAILRRQRAWGPFASTLMLASFLEELRADLGDEHQKLPLTQIIFCAIRVFLNREVDQLREALGGALQRVQPFGRIAVITFKRWEIHTVRDFAREYEESPGLREQPSSITRVDARRLLQLYPLLRCGGTRAIRRVATVRPGQEELAQNPRARSATLHVFEVVPFEAAAMATDLVAESSLRSADRCLLEEPKRPS